MATTIFRRDHLLRRIVNPGTTATDYLGRLTTATLDSNGRALVAIDWPGAVANALGDYVDIPATRIVYRCTVAGTSAVGAPTAPGVGNTVVSGTTTWVQLTSAGT
jgi:hypothetical protein